MLHTESIGAVEPRYARDRQIAARYGVSRITIWRWANKGLIPKPRKAGPRCSLFDISATDAAVEKMLADGGAS